MAGEKDYAHKRACVSMCMWCVRVVCVCVCARAYECICAWCAVHSWRMGMVLWRGFCVLWRGFRVLWGTLP